MTLYELTSAYGKDKGVDMMWETVEIISDAVEESMPEEEKHELERKIYGKLSDGHYNEEYAKEDVKEMYYLDRSGKEHYAPYWTETALHEIYDSVRNKIPSYNKWDFCVCFNMVASDNWMLLHSWWPDMTDAQFAEKVTEMAVNWLDDPDNPYGDDSKIWSYLNGGE